MRSSTVRSGTAAFVLAAAAALTFSAPASAADTAKPKPVAEGSAPGAITPMHCSGHTPHNDVDQRGYARLFTGDSVNIRRYPHTGCTSDGHGYRTHNVDYHCWEYGDSVTRNGLVYDTWTYLRNVTTGVHGWVSDAYLASNGDRDDRQHRPLLRPDLRGARHPGVLRTRATTTHSTTHSTVHDRVDTGRREFTSPKPQGWPR